MRKHRLFGVVIATLLGAGLLGQRPGAQPAGHVGLQLVSHTIRTTGAPVTVPVRTEGFTTRSASAASDDTLMALSSNVKPLPPIAAPPTTHTVTAPAKPATPTPGAWAALRGCESSDNYLDNTGNGYYGAYQFSLATWQSLGYGELPSDAPPAVQDQAAQQLQSQRGWSQWPTCARRLGLI